MKAPHAVAIRGGESRRVVVSAVRRCALEGEPEAVGVVVGSQQCRQLVGLNRDIDRRLGAEHEEEVEALRLFGCQPQPDAHSDLHRDVEVGHPADALVDWHRFVTGIVSERRRVGTDGESIRNRRPGSGHHQLTAGVAEHPPPPGEHPSDRCPCPRLALGADVRKLDRPVRQRLGLGDRLGRKVVEVQRGEHAGDPRSSRSVEALDELVPRHPAGRLVAAGAPRALPEVRAPRELGVRQFRFVRVDVNRIGVDAHVQVGAAIGPREEAGLETDGQEEQRFGGTERQRRLQVGMDGDRRDRRGRVDGHRGPGRVMGGTRMREWRPVRGAAW